MQFFPSLYVEGSPWLIPMCDGASVVLIDVLLAEESAQRCKLLQNLFKEDPASLLWTLCCAAQYDVFPQAIDATANWLSQNLFQVFQWNSTDEPEESVDSMELLTNWQPLAAECLAIAQRAEELAGGQKEHAYLLGLLHRACDWFYRPRDLPLSEEEFLAVACLPNWLRESLAAISANDKTEKDFPVSSVIAAKAEIANPQEKTLSGQSDLAYQTTSPSRNGSLWKVLLPGTPPKLPLFVDKLNRLFQLENHFQEELLKEKLASLREFTYGASHEINNPLANISSRAQLMLRDEKDKEQRRKLSMIHSHAMRAHEMITSIALFAKPPKLEVDRLNLIDLVDLAIDELEPIAHERVIRFSRTSSDEPLPITADEVQLMIAIKAVCKNALEAVGPGGCVEVSARRINVGPKIPGVSNRIEIAVRDDGPGMSLREKRHLFDPFFSGREAGRGQGFGLSKCWQIVTEHRGRVTVESEPGEGTCVTILLPEEPAIDKQPILDSTLSK